MVHDAVINSGIHDLVAANGAVPLPLDCSAGRRRRAGPALRALGRRRRDPARRRGRARPPATSSRCCCAPTAAAPTRWSSISSTTCSRTTRTPCSRATVTAAAAGYVTRVQAFLHAVRGYREARRVASPTPRRRASGAVPGAAPHAARALRAAGRRCRCAHNRDRTFVFGNIGGSGGRFAAAAMRGAGIDARFVGATSRGRPRPAAVRAVRARSACPTSSSGARWPTTSRRAGDTHGPGRLRVREHRPRLSGLPPQPVPGRAADPARAPRLRQAPSRWPTSACCSRTGR